LHSQHIGFDYSLVGEKVHEANGLRALHTSQVKLCLGYYYYINVVRKVNRHRSCR